jgi:hypothetical protein
MTIIAEEAKDVMASRMQIVKEDEVRLKQEEEELKSVKALSSGTGVQEDAKPSNPMSEMAKALKAARAAKLLEKKAMDEEAKKKEEMQTQPMTSMSAMIAAIKRAKAEK